jgi:hypothetical protein
VIADGKVQAFPVRFWGNVQKLQNPETMEQPLEVVRNGLIQTQPDDYVLMQSSTKSPWLVAFLNAPSAGDILLFIAHV